MQKVVYIFYFIIKMRFNLLKYFTNVFSLISVNNNYLFKNIFIIFMCFNVSLFLDILSFTIPVI